MDTVIKNYLEQMKVGRKQSHKNLALYPLLSTYSVGLEYLLLDEALNENLIEIVEKVCNDNYTYPLTTITLTHFF